MLTVASVVVDSRAAHPKFALEEGELGVGEGGAPASRSLAAAAVAVVVAVVVVVVVVVVFTLRHRVGLN